MIDLAALKAALEAATKGELVSIPAGNRPEIWTDDGKVLVCRVESLRFVDDAAYIVATQPRVMRELIERLERYERALEQIAEEHDAGRHDGLPEPCPAHEAGVMWHVARSALAGDRHD